MTGVILTPATGIDKLRVMNRFGKGLSRNVLALGTVSLLTDISSEMIYPLLPLFLTATLGVHPAFLGVIEGAAESTAAFLKWISGLWSDRIRNRTKLVAAGYTLSSLARPLVAAAVHPAFVLAIRVCDRVGKGLRTSPRDAILADSVDPSLRGKVYGFHRTMDHTGAVIGPLAASLILATVTKDMRTIFWLAGIPGILSVILVVFGVKEPALNRPMAPPQVKFNFARPQGRLLAFLAVLFLFTLGNSADAFLLLKAVDLGVPAAEIPLVWITLHLVKMGSTFPFGWLSDHTDRKWMLAGGWLVFALAYMGFAFANAAWHAWALFAFYGLFYGMTEGAERALIADLAGPANRGSAFGWYHGVVGLGALPASVLFGFLWQRYDPKTAFLFGAVLALTSAALLLLSFKSPVKTVPTTQLPYQADEPV